jgi:vacuolar-type H+-ATPase subunit I/STV1
MNDTKEQIEEYAEELESLMDSLNDLKDCQGDERIDTRDLMDRQSELEGIADFWNDLDEEVQKVLIDEYRDDIYFRFVNCMSELKEINEIENYAADFLYGETLIRQDKFVDYAQELATDLGDVSDSTWIVIDWEATAENLQQDFSTVEYCGEEYFVRS